MSLVSYGPAFAGALFFGMLLFLEVGYRLGIRRRAMDPEGAAMGIGAVNGAVFGLLGLLVAFTFSGAASRFDSRRGLIVEETNAIGTAWLRLDLLPEDEQPALRDLFRRFLDARLETYRLLPDLAAAESKYAESLDLLGDIWSHAVGACEGADSTAVTTLVLTSMNAMFDTVATRTEVALIHPPVVIFGLLFGLGLGCALLAGYGMSGSRARNWVHIIGFAAVLSLAVYVIMEIEFPRTGVIRIDESDRTLIQLRESMD